MCTGQVAHALPHAGTDRRGRVRIRQRRAALRWRMTEPSRTKSTIHNVRSCFSPVHAPRWRISCIVLSYRTGPGRLTWYGFWPSPYGRLNVGDSRPSKRRVVAVLIAHRTPCSDFRLTSRVSHNRTERALQLASHVSTSSPAQRCWSCQSCPPVQLPCTAGRDRMRVVPT